MCGRFSDIQPAWRLTLERFTPEISALPTPVRAVLRSQPARRLPLERFSPEVVRSPLEISRGERTTSQVLPRNGRGGRARLGGHRVARRGPGGCPGGRWLAGCAGRRPLTGEVNCPGSGRNPPPVDMFGV